jgi:NAD(P)-dependent dehydrogenase (short-subunit alcohol dehydrogenase family)
VAGCGSPQAAYSASKAGLIGLTRDLASAAAGYITAATPVVDSGLTAF